MLKFREDSIPEKTKELRNMVYKKLKGQYQTLRALFRKELASLTGDTPPCEKFKLCKQTIFCEYKPKEFFKNISGQILNFKCFYLKENWPRRNATQSQELM